MCMCVCVALPDLFPPSPIPPLFHQNNAVVFTVAVLLFVFVRYRGGGWVLRGGKSCGRRIAVVANLCTATPRPNPPVCPERVDGMDGQARQGRTKEKRLTHP